MTDCRIYQRCFCAIAAGAALLVGQSLLRADDAPADPSFSSTSDVRILTPSAQFGTYRQGQPANPIPVTVYNRAPSPGSPMSLVHIDQFPPESAITLQNTPTNPVPAGGSATMQLALSTSQPDSHLQVFYRLQFTSDTRPDLPNPPPLDLTAYAAVLPAGDFNNDQVVDDIDYVLWRKTRNTSVTAWTSGDSNGDGLVNDDDYNAWRRNFGVALAGSGPENVSSNLSASAVVPEPNSAMLGLLTLGIAGLHARSRSRHRCRLT